MPELTVSLGPDSAGTLLTAALAGARTGIDAAVYEVGPSYRWVFVDVARRGRQVRLLLDAHASDGNAATAGHVDAAGGSCRVLGGDARASHWKLVAVDGRRVAVGTGNLIWRDLPRDPHGRLPPAADPLPGTREWWAVVSAAPAIARAARRAFDAAWQAASPPPPGWRAVAPAAVPEAAVGTPRPQVPPLSLSVRRRSLRLLTGGPAVAAQMTAMIAGARSRVFITTPYVHPGVRSVAGLLAGSRLAARRGADVRLLLGAREHGADERALRALGFPVCRMDPARSTRGHAKGLVADGAALISSANWSAGGLDLNWEAALAVHHPGVAEYYASAFLRDWDVSDPL